MHFVWKYFPPSPHFKQALRKHGIQSAPVLLAPSIEDHDEGAYLGIVDTMMILHAIIGAVAKAEGKGLYNSLSAKWEKMDAIGSDVMNRKLITIIGTMCCVLPCCVSPCRVASGVSFHFEVTPVHYTLNISDHSAL